VYLDHAATSPLRPEAQQVWLEASALTGNPSSLHASGRSSRRIVEEAREGIASALSCRPSEVIFTAGGTESDNLAVKGLAWGARGKSVILRSPIEHHAVLDPIDWLCTTGEFTVTDVRVDHRGRVDVADLISHLSEDVALCTVMWANNEVGTVQPIAEIAAACASAGVAFHTDAVQAIGMLEVSADLEGLTALTISGHKIGAPVGTGALILDRDASIVPVLHGGGQERDVRSGTVDAASAAALAAAVTAAVTEQRGLFQRLEVMRDDLIRRVLAAIPEAQLMGDPGLRLPGNACFIFPGCEGDALLMLLDAAGVECSTGSACTSGVPDPSHVLLAMGVDPHDARGALRFSLGRTSSDGDVDALLEVLPGVVERARRAGRPRMVVRS
jgi:cysteine desulfurase